MTIFDEWFGSVHAVATDWYRDNLVHVNLAFYYCSHRLNCPDFEKSFLLKGSHDRILSLRDSIVHKLSDTDELRDENGRLNAIIEVF